jgi:hypothetical protein
MWLLAVIDEQCMDCGMCRVNFPDFNHNGRRLPISRTDPAHEEWRRQALFIHDTCPEKAIIYKIFRPVSRSAAK